MSERTFKIHVTQIVEVKLDASKFDDAFMAEFRKGFFPFTTLKDHAEHIGQMVARGIHEPTIYSNEFIEGYGPSLSMGITARVTDTEVEAL